MTTYSLRIGDEVMKRWLKTGTSATFHTAPSGVHWSHKP